MAKFKVGDRVRVSERAMRHWNEFHAQVHGKKTEFAVTALRLVYVDGLPGYQLEGAVWWTEKDLLPATSPIRTVTRREIVPGVYGAAEVDDEFVRTTVWLYGDTAADDLREAAHLFNQLAEVLEENAAADKKEAA